MFVEITIGQALRFFLEPGVRERGEHLLEPFIVRLVGGGLLFEGEDEGAEEGGDGHVAACGGDAGVVIDLIGELDGDVAHGTPFKAAISEQK